MNKPDPIHKILGIILAIILYAGVMGILLIGLFKVFVFLIHWAV